MDLEPFLAQLRRDLTAAAQTGDEQVRTAAAHLIAALDPAARLVLLDVLVTAADELTAAGDATIEVRLTGRSVELVAHLPAAAGLDPADAALTSDADASTARVSLRLPETLKSRAEARATAEGISLNTWLVRTVAAGVDGRGGRRGQGPGTRLTGWARS